MKEVLKFIATIGTSITTCYTYNKVQEVLIIRDIDKTIMKATDELCELNKDDKSFYKGCKKYQLEQQIKRQNKVYYSKFENLIICKILSKLGYDVTK